MLCPSRGRNEYWVDLNEAAVKSPTAFDVEATMQEYHHDDDGHHHEEEEGEMEGDEMDKKVVTREMVLQHIQGKKKG